MLLLCRCSTTTQPRKNRCRWMLCQQIQTHPCSCPLRLSICQRQHRWSPCQMTLQTRSQWRQRVPSCQCLCSPSSQHPQQQCLCRSPCQPQSQSWQPPTLWRLLSFPWLLMTCQQPAAIPSPQQQPQLLRHRQPATASPACCCPPHPLMRMLDSPLECAAVRASGLQRRPAKTCLQQHAAHHFCRTATTAARLCSSCNLHATTTAEQQGALPRLP
jgi:hypothetical protein